MSNVHRVKNGKSLRRYRFVPYEEIVGVLKKDGSAFLEETDDRPLKPQTMWKAARKLSEIVGKKVGYYPSFLRLDREGEAVYLVGYTFQLEGEGSPPPLDSEV